MSQMKIKIKIDDSFLLKLNRSKGKIIMTRGAQLYRIADFTVIEEDLTVKKGIFKKTTEVIKQKYLTKFVVHTYNHAGRFVGILTDDSAARFGQMSDIYQMRNNWEDFEDMLQAFGLQVTKLPETNVPELP